MIKSNGRVTLIPREVHFDPSIDADVPFWKSCYYCSCPETRPVTIWKTYLHHSCCHYLWLGDCHCWWWSFCDAWYASWRFACCSRAADCCYYCLRAVARDTWRETTANDCCCLTFQYCEYCQRNNRHWFPSWSCWPSLTTEDLRRSCGYEYWEGVSCC